MGAVPGAGSGPPIYGSAPTALAREASASRKRCKRVPHECGVRVRGAGGGAGAGGNGASGGVARPLPGNARPPLPRSAEGRRPGRRAARRTGRPCRGTRWTAPRRRARPRESARRITLASSRNAQEPAPAPAQAGRRLSPPPPLPDPCPWGLRPGPPYRPRRPRPQTPDGLKGAPCPQGGAGRRGAGRGTGSIGEGRTAEGDGPCVGGRAVGLGGGRTEGRPPTPLTLAPAPVRAPRSHAQAPSHGRGRAGESNARCGRRHHRTDTPDHTTAATGGSPARTRPTHPPDKRRNGTADGDPVAGEREGPHPRHRGCGPRSRYNCPAVPLTCGSGCAARTA